MADYGRKTKYSNENKKPSLFIVQWVNANSTSFSTKTLYALVQQSAFLFRTLRGIISDCCLEQRQYIVSVIVTMCFLWSVQINFNII